MQKTVKVKNESEIALEECNDNFLVKKMMSLEEQCTLLCMMTDYLACECGALGFFDPNGFNKYNCKTCILLEQVANSWNDILCRLDSSQKYENLVKSLFSNLEKSTVLFKQHGLGHYFEKTMSYAKSLVHDGKITGCNPAYPMIPRTYYISGPKVSKILLARNNLRCHPFDTEKVATKKEGTVRKQTFFSDSDSDWLPSNCFSDVVSTDSEMEGLCTDSKIRGLDSLSVGQDINVCESHLPDNYLCSSPQPSIITNLKTSVQASRKQESKSKTTKDSNSNDQKVDPCRVTLPSNTFFQRTESNSLMRDHISIDSFSINSDSLDSLPSIDESLRHPLTSTDEPLRLSMVLSQEYSSSPSIDSKNGNNPVIKPEKDKDSIVWTDHDAAEKPLQNLKFEKKSRKRQISDSDIGYLSSSEDESKQTFNTESKDNLYISDGNEHDYELLSSSSDELMFNSNKHGIKGSRSKCHQYYRKEDLDEKEMTWNGHMMKKLNDIEKFNISDKTSLKMNCKRSLLVSDTEGERKPKQSKHSDEKENAGMKNFESSEKQKHQKSCQKLEMRSETHGITCNGDSSLLDTKILKNLIAGDEKHKEENPILGNQETGSHVKKLEKMALKISQEMDNWNGKPILPEYRSPDLSYRMNKKLDLKREILPSIETVSNDETVKVKKLKRTSKNLDIRDFFTKRMT